MCIFSVQYISPISIKEELVKINKDSGVFITYIGAILEFTFRLDRVSNSGKKQNKKGRTLGALPCL